MKNVSKLKGVVSNLTTNSKIIFLLMSLVYIAVISSLVVGTIAYIRATNQAQNTEEGSFNITWNITDENATATATASEKWIYSKVGNVVVIKGSGFRTLMSITADSNTRYFLGQGLPTKLLPGPTSEIYILVATIMDEWDDMELGVLNFKNINTDPNNIGQLTLNQTTYYGFGWMNIYMYPWIPPASTFVGVRPYAFSYKIG